MKESIIVLFFFSVGVLGGRLDLLPAGWLGLVHEASNLAVYAMLAAVGMSLGFDSRAWRILRDLKGWVVLVPLMIIVGTCPPSSARRASGTPSLGSSQAWCSPLPSPSS